MSDKIESTSEAWDLGTLGQDEEFVAKADLKESDYNEALDLQMISIRLQKSLIADLKSFATIHKLGYQPLMKIILQRWVDGELKTMGSQIMMERIQEMEEIERQVEIEQQSQLEETAKKRA